MSSHDRGYRYGAGRQRLQGQHDDECMEVSINVRKMVGERGEGSVGDLLQAYLQRPYYWSWGGIPTANITNRWPKKEDRLKKADGRHKSVKIVTLNATDSSDVVERNQKLYEDSFFTDATDFEGNSTSSTSTSTNTSDYMIDRVTSVFPTSSTVDYRVDAARSKWNFSDSIEEANSSNVLNGSKANEVYVHNRTVVLVTGDSLLPKFLNDTLDYGTCHNGSHWSNGTECESNYTSTADSFDNEDALHLAAMVATAFVLGVIILATVIGNVFVIAAILLERNLQNVANYLILSLAVADLLVACLVMPLGAVYEVSKQWNLGPELCDMWTSSDVLCCTASILHLVAIALDRYWAVTNIDYIHQRTSRRIGVMILIIWGVAFLVCIAPMLGWKDAEWEERIYRNQTCLVSQDIGYQVFATLSSFYVPLLVILILYWRIFQTARKRIRRRTNQGIAAGAPPRNPSAGGVVAGAAGGSGGIAAAVVAVIGRPLPTISETTTAFTTVSSTNTSPERQPLGNGVEPDLPTADCMSSYQQTLPYPMPKTRVKEAADSKRERKAAKTLAIITGAFVMCWLPFFILAILLPICKTCDFNPYMLSFFLWLGYFNSTLNPIIYTIFSPEFRHAFKRLLCGRKGSIRRRNVRHFGQRHFQ